MHVIVWQWRRVPRRSGLSPQPRDRLAVELTVLVCLKLALLYLIWQIWFSSPLAKDMQVAPSDVARHVLGDANAAPIRSPGTDP